MPAQQRGRADRAGPEAAGGPIGGELDLPAAVLAGAELQLLRSRVGVDQALGPHTDQPDPAPGRRPNWTSGTPNFADGTATR